MDTIQQMKLFMEPRSIAIIGVSRQTGEGSFNIVENLISLGYSGKVYPINPSFDECLGLKTYPSVQDLPEDIDLAIIATPRSSVPGIIKECAEKNIKAIIAVAQGFADADERGKMLQAEVQRIAREGGTRVIGPNTLGVANAYCNLSTAFTRLELVRNSIGFISQTGIFFPGLPRVLPAGKAIDLGNACDIDFADALEYYENDPLIKLIILHIEGIRNGTRFIEVASRVARKKPILALKGGRSKRGAETARSHTGSLTGRDEVYDAAFKQSGIIRVSDIDELSDLAKAFLCLPLMKGNRIGVITFTGAGGTLAADACEKYGLKTAELSPETLSEVTSLLPPWLKKGNPLDVYPAVGILRHDLRDICRRILQIFTNDNHVDAILFIGGLYANLESWDPTKALLQHVTEFKDKPLVSWLYGPYSEKSIASLERTGKVAVFPSCERAVRALARLREYSESLEIGTR